MVFGICFIVVISTQTGSLRVRPRVCVGLWIERRAAKGRADDTSYVVRSRAKVRGHMADMSTRDRSEYQFGVTKRAPGRPVAEEMSACAHRTPVRGFRATRRLRPSCLSHDARIALPVCNIRRSIFFFFLDYLRTFFFFTFSARFVRT